MLFMVYESFGCTLIFLDWGELPCQGEPAKEVLQVATHEG